MQPNPTPARPIRPTRPVWFGTGRGLILVSVFALGLLVAIALPFLLVRSMRSGPAPQTASALSTANIGGNVTIAVLANGPPESGVLAGTMLEPRDSTSYTKTSSIVQIRLAPNATVTMGTLADVRAGAVFQVTGELIDRQTVDGRQIVILTGYVKVN